MQVFESSVPYSASPQFESFLELDLSF